MPRLLFTRGCCPSDPALNTQVLFSLILIVIYYRKDDRPCLLLVNGWDHSCKQLGLLGPLAVPIRDGVFEEARRQVEGKGVREGFLGGRFKRNHFERKD